jgi:hypothetical protein
MKLTTPNYFGTLAGNGGTALLVTPAQHRAYDIALGTSTRREFTGLDLRLYYSGQTGANAASDAPTIVAVTAEPSGAGAIFTARVTGNPAVAVHEVWVTYTSAAGGSGSWTSLDLVQCVDPLPMLCATLDSQIWKAEVASLPADARYIVQAANGLGLVSADDNLGRYYAVGVNAAQPSNLAITVAPSSATFGSSAQVSATLSSASTALAGRIVTVSAGGSSQSGVTNAGGNVTINVPILATPGVYPLTASFAGDAAYLPSAASVPAFTVTQAPTLLTAAGAGSGAILTAALGSNTQPVTQESVYFAVTGPLGPKVIPVITDYTGLALFPPPGLPSGAYTITAARYCPSGIDAFGACLPSTSPYANASLSFAGGGDVYAFGGFLSPIDSPPALNSVKAGQSVPVKFSLGGNRGLDIFDPGFPASSPMSCGLSPGNTITPAVSAGGSTLQYNAASDQYSFIWKTDGSWSNSCRMLILNLKDGTQKVAYFQFKK